MNERIHKSIEIVCCVVDFFVVGTYYLIIDWWLHSSVMGRNFWNPCSRVFLTVRYYSFLMWDLTIWSSCCTCRWTRYLGTVIARRVILDVQRGHIQYEDILSQKIKRLRAENRPRVSLFLATIKKWMVPDDKETRENKRKWHMEHGTHPKKKSAIARDNREEQYISFIDRKSSALVYGMRAPQERGH